MPRLGIGLSDAESQRELPVQLRMGQEQISTSVQPIHNRLIGRIAGLVPEANQVERSESGEFITLIPAHPTRKFLCQAHVLAYVMLQPFDSVVSNHKPQLQRAEPAPQLNMQSR